RGRSTGPGAPLGPADRGAARPGRLYRALRRDGARCCRPGPHPRRRNLRRLTEPFQSDVSLLLVMAGLDPAIHEKKTVDPRDKPGSVTAGTSRGMTDQGT